VLVLTGLDDEEVGLKAVQVCYHCGRKLEPEVSAGRPRS